MYLAKRNCHPVILFWEAFCYAEMRYPQEMVGKIFVSFCIKNDDGTVLLTHVPQVVENYCLDCLAGRAKPMAYQLKLEAKNDTEDESTPQEDGI